MQIEFGCPVVSGGDILRQNVVFVDVANLYVRLAKITKLHIPVLVDQNVKWLEVPMNNTFRVNIEHTLHDFVNQILDMVSVHG